LHKLRFGLTLTLVFFIAMGSACFAQSSVAKFDGSAWWKEVKVLADDNMEGRGTGTPGLQRAEAYVVEQLKQAGIQPAGTNGFYQPIKFRTRLLDESQSSLSLVQNGKTQSVAFGDEAILSTRVDLAPQVDAPLVFAGYGLRVPEMNYDDFAGLDVKGKVIVTFSGSPASVPGPLASHYNSAAEKARLMRELGVLGSINVPNPYAMDLPWSRIASSRSILAMAIDDPSMDESKGIQLAVTWNPAKAEELFEGSGHTFSEIANLGKDRKPLPHFPLNKSVRARAKLIETKVESANLIGKIPGSDPKLKDEYVVLSAHIDHLGIGPAINGDKIYNGAMDNGSGTAAILEVAKSLTGEKLKRSVLVVFVTGEEKGLLGSRYFAAHPTVPAHSMVADINTDMFLPIFPMKSLIVYGLEESTLGDTVTEVAKQDGIKTLPDPEPLLNHFIRSDQYSFIKQGIPSLALKVGFDKGSPEEAQVHAWSKERYHAPSDDLNQPVDLPAAAKFEEVVRGLAVNVANTETRPTWKSDSFFRRYADEQTAGK
jgi:Zn-dependent M28 family amino/carboxypeptidase